MIEQILVLLLVFGAGSYIFRHLKTTLTIGEGGKKCAHCALNTIAPKFKSGRP